MGSTFTKEEIEDLKRLEEATHITLDIFLKEMVGWWVGVNYQGKQQRWYIHPMTDEFI